MKPFGHNQTPNLAVVQPFEAGLNGAPTGALAGSGIEGMAVNREAMDAQRVGWLGGLSVRATHIAESVQHVYSTVKPYARSAVEGFTGGVINFAVESAEAGLGNTSVGTGNGAQRFSSELKTQHEAYEDAGRARAEERGRGHGVVRNVGKFGGHLAAAATVEYLGPRTR